MRAAIFGTMLSLALLGGVAAASHVEPAKGKGVSFSLVNGFRICDSPNTMTSTGQDACAPPQAEGASPCALSATGSGKLTLKAIGSTASGNEDVLITAGATGLNDQCHNLCVKLSLRATTDDCPEGSCTMTDFDDFYTNACCTVANGKCKIKTTLSAALPGVFVTGKNTGIEVRGCGLKDSLGIILPAEIACGFLLK